MSTLPEHTHRASHHRQPRRWHTDATTPGFTHPDESTPCPNEHCQGGAIDTTPTGATHPALQSDTPCPVCDGTGERSTTVKHTCQWVVFCTRPAAYLGAHPVLAPVPVCAEHADQHLLPHELVPIENAIAMGWSE